MIRALRGRNTAELLGPGAVYLGATMLNAAIPFLLLPLIARWLGPADFGVIGSFLAIVGVLVMMVGLNAYGYVSVSYYRNGAETLPGVVGAALAVILVTSAIVGMAGSLAAGAIEYWIAIDAAWLWTLLAAATGQAILAVGLTVAQTIRRPFVYAAFQLGYGIAMGVLTLILVGAFAMGWPGRALAQAVAALAIAGGALVWLRATGRMTLAIDRRILSRVLGFGIPLLPHAIAAVAMGSMDRLALGGGFTPAVVGQYFLALQLASVFMVIAAAVNQAWVPWLYQRLSRGDAPARREILIVIRIGGGLLLAGATALAALAAPVVVMVGGEEFSAAALPLRILAGYAAFQAWYTLLSAFLFYAERTKLMSAVTTTVAVIQGVLILILLPWGAAGVATALLLSALSGAVAISLIVARLFARTFAAKSEADVPSI